MQFALETNHSDLDKSYFIRRPKYSSEPVFKKYFKVFHITVVAVLEMTVVLTDSNVTPPLPEY